MISFLPHISTFLVILPAALAGIFYRFSPTKFFNYYLFGCLFTELLLFYKARLGVSNWWIIYLFLLFEVITLGATFYKLVVNELLAKLILYGTVLVAALGMILQYLDMNYLMHHIQNTFLVAISAAFLVDFIGNDRSFELWRSGKLWIGIGVFFYFFSSALVFILIEPMLITQNGRLFGIYNIMHSCINIVAYLIYAYAMICKK